MAYTRQPCPIRIVEDTGCAFMMGTIGGTMFQYVKGFRNGREGLRRRLYDGLVSVKIKTPSIAGSFAVWGATFSTVDCTMAHYRQQEDAWNSIVSGATTSGLLVARQGIRQMAGSALIGCLVMALMEGSNFQVNAPRKSPGETHDKPPHAQWELVREESKKKL